ncbi:hypothetical protein ACFX5U_12395 [Sphingobacterium sp. SG20118]|uniref:hypothetical protein n=1 Tax=Sphingobacterium sp. SG20118 TaxID=3367156 RepID=UPI0037DFC140
MSIVKIPKKFRDILNTLRSGQIVIGLEQLEKIKGFEPQKAIVNAEIDYFNSNYESAMTNDENGLPFNDQWYAGNVLSEHFSAYTNTALRTGNISRAEGFYNNFLTEKEKLNLPEHQIRTYRHQINHHLAKLKGENGLSIWSKPLKIVKDGKSTDEFIAQLKECRPQLTFDSEKGAEYLLHFMLESGNTDESLTYYEKFADKIFIGDIHINAARLFLLTGQIDKANQALVTFAKNWYPVEHIQITPMVLFDYEDLLPLLTKEFKQEILNIPKGNQ